MMTGVTRPPTSKGTPGKRMARWKKGHVIMIVGGADDPEGFAQPDYEESNDLSRHAVYSAKCNSGDWMPQSAGNQAWQHFFSLKVQDPGQVEGARSGWCVMEL